MTTIRQQDFIDSIADALQFISYYHPADYIHALADAYSARGVACRERCDGADTDQFANVRARPSPDLPGHRHRRGLRARRNGCALGRRYDEHDRDGERGRAQSLSVAGQRAARFHRVSDPAGKRKNTRDNTPAVVHFEIVPGDKVDVRIAAKGGGSENKARFAMLNPSDDVVEWVVSQLPGMGAGWCPPGMLGIGIGGTAEKAMLLAKESLMEPIDMTALKARGAQNRIEELRIEIYDKVNALGIGAQGLGGLTTVLDVKILDYPTHAASKPVAMIPNCAATRHIDFELDGSGVAQFTPPKLEDYPDVHWKPSPDARRVNLDTVTRADIAKWQPGETLLLSGKLLTGRDAAHKRMVEMLAKGETVCRWISTDALSTTSARSIRCATRSSGPPDRPPRRAWTNSPKPCWRRPA